MKHEHPVFIKHTGENTFVFRAPYNKHELKALLALRYRIFRETKGDWVFPSNNAELDLDCYDLQALHFGLFKCGEGKNVEETNQKCVGHIRLVIGNRVSHIAPMVMELADDILDLDSSWRTPPQYRLPHFNLIDEEVAKIITQKADEENQILVETSRYAIDTEGQSMTLALFTISSIMEAAHFYFNGEAVRFYVMVSEFHAPIYRMFGFTDVQEIVPKGTAEKYIILTHSMDRVAEILLLAEQNPTVPIHRLKLGGGLGKAA